MAWTIENSRGFESDKIAHLVVPYLQGKGLDLGCGLRKVWPSCIGVDNLLDYRDARPDSVDVVSNCADLSVFADDSLDYVFSSHLLEHFYLEDVPKVLKEWSRVIKPGGFLVLYVPSSNLYPKVGQEGANPDHKWDIYPGDVEKHLFAATKCGWTQLESEERDRENEYSIYEVYQKRSDGNFVKNLWQRNPEGKQRCLVIRYGAIGDAIMTASVFPGLKEQGYHVTMMCAPSTYEILKNDPYVDEWSIQAKDFVPNSSLGAFWEQIRLEGRYARIINLCESVEGGLLTLPGRIQHLYPEEMRRKLCNVNYLERTHDIAGVPYSFNARFYPTEEEKEWARGIRAQCGGPVVVWAINGSAAHKVYPWTQVIVSWLMEKTPAHVFLMADPGIGAALQQGMMSVLQESGVDMSRIHPMAGVWSIRQALTFAQFADCVVGPETGTLNAVGMENVAKVIYLSHSSQENLTKHWVNTTVLEPEATKCACFPCHRLHYNWDYCNKDEKTSAALCSASISPERVLQAIAQSLGATVTEKAA